MADLPLADRHDTVLPPAPDEAREALAHALAADSDATGGPGATPRPTAARRR